MPSQHTDKNKPYRYTHTEIATSISLLNAHLDRLGDSVLPKQPYLLSVPSDIPYRHSSRFVNTWYEGTPFDRKEEQIQYVSFLPHQGEHENLLRVVGGWSDEQGNFLEEEPSPRTVYNSGRNTPLDHSQRKKISLKDYKTKDKLTLDEEADPLQIVGLPKGDSTRTEEKGTGGLDTKKPERAHQATRESKPVGDTTVPARMDARQSRPSATKHDAKDPSPRPSKRRKLSLSSPDRKVTPPASPRAKRESSPRKMPKLLSPTLPSPEKESGLPELLSPLLPPTLVKAIATPPPSVTADVSSSNHHRSESVRSILANTISESSPRPTDKAGPLSGSLVGSRNRSDSQHSIKSNASGSGTAQPSSKAPVKPFLKATTPLQSESRSPGPRQRRTIILKYGKKNRKRVEALLKFGARPKKTAARLEPAAHLADPVVKQQPPGDNLSKKHVRDASPEPPLKTIKAIIPSSDAPKRPSTPILARTKEQVVASTPILSGAKSIQSTPKKELKSTAMRRIESTDGGEPSTPGDRRRGSTPLGVDRGPTTLKPSPGPTSAPNRDEDRQAWNQLNSRYFALGRTIKHEGTSVGPSPAAEIDNKDSAKSVVLLIEALLCFMINLAAMSQYRPSADPGWTTIIPYHIYVFRASRKFPHLHGLVVQLGAVCRQLIHKHDLDRLARDPLPDEYCGAAPTPGSDGNTKTNEDAERYKKKYLDFRDSLVRNARELQTAWLDGFRYLSPDILERDYAKTWAGRTKDSSQRMFEKPSPTTVSPDYYLPLDATTTAFEAVRFSLALLEEWTEKEGVEWRTRIDL